jgi:hypothetical protein
MEGILIYDERDQGKTNTIFARGCFVFQSQISGSDFETALMETFTASDSEGDVYHKKSLVAT